MAKIKTLELKPPKFIPNYSQDTVSWEDAFRNWNESLTNNEWIKPGVGHFVSHRADRIPEVQVALKDLNISVAHLYIGIDVTSPGYGKHVDMTDVYFWQQKGSTRWEFDTGDVFILKEGDMVYVPKGVYHEVTSLEARFGISMCSDAIRRSHQFAD